jgi:hypothetical protein
MQPTAHSRFGASSAYRWMKCPASVRMSEGAERQESEYALEGTMLHEIAARILMKWIEHDSQNEQLADEFRKLNDDQRNVVSAYTRVVRDEEHILALDDDNTNTMIEQRFSLPSLHPEFFGTADAVISTRRALRVIDLKCGSGVAVAVDTAGRINPQLGYYALGALAALGWNVSINGIVPPRGLEDQTDIEIIVVQPRLGGIKRRKVAIVELLDLAEDLVFAAKLADTFNPPVKAGDWCRFCAARASCPTLREKVLEEARMDFSTGDIVAPQLLEGNELTRALRSADLMDLWIKAVRDHARAQIEQGRRVPGFKLVQRVGHRKWKDEAVTTETLVSTHGVREDDLVTRSVKSPAQVERVLKSYGIDRDVIDDLVVRGSSGVVLVPEEDARPAARVGAAADFD